MEKAFNLFLATLLLSTIFVDATIPASQVPPVQQPSHLQEYYQLRNGCEWKLVEKQSITVTNDSGLLHHEIMSCEVEASFPEGKGYYRILRTGPFVTNGGFDEIDCRFGASAAFSRQEHQVDWMTRSVSGPVDPYSGLFVGYPPVHLHHAVVKSNPSYNPPQSDITRATIFKPKAGLWGTVSASSQCQESMGGTGCFARVLPIGYGIQRSQDINPETMEVAVHLQDVREPNSSPMLSSVEFSIFYLTEPNQEMKDFLHFEIEIGDRTDPYETSSDSELYQFGTHYMPTTMQVMSNTFHAHSMPGDEIWIVRGTQADLGIPEELWREPIYQYQEKASRKQMAHAVPINEKIDTLYTLKTRMEDALEFAADKRRKELANTADASSGLHKVKPSNPHEPPKSYTVPEILCKYYGTVETIDDDMVRKDQQRFVDAYAKYGWIDSNSATASASTKPIVGSHYENWPVSAADQLKAMFGSIMRGSYYRNTDSSQDLNEAHNNQCNSFTVEEGEYITIVHFNVKREKAPANEFPFDKLTDIQHTFLVGEAHLLDVTDDA